MGSEEGIERGGRGEEREEGGEEKVKGDGMGVRET